VRPNEIGVLRERPDRMRTTRRAKTLVNFHDVGFAAHHGLNSDITLGRKCANRVMLTVGWPLSR
jgi:hypothetical protein